MHDELPEGARVPNKIRILQWNAEGIAAKRVEFTEYLHQTLPDLVAVRESKLRVSDDIAMPGYHVLRRDRRQRRSDDTHASGGVIALVREGIAFRTPALSAVWGPNDRTTDWCVVETCEASKITVINMYVHSTHPENTRVQNF